MIIVQFSSVVIEVYKLLNFATSRDYSNNGHFIFKQVQDFYFISTQQQPDWYIYMQDNSDRNIRACKGDPGKKGHWKTRDILTTKPEH